MENNMEKTNSHNPGIKCVVNTCHYYDKGDYCTAQKIEVQHRDAQNAHETDCVTFKQTNSLK